MFSSGLKHVPWRYVSVTRRHTEQPVRTMTRCAVEEPLPAQKKHRSPFSYKESVLRKKYPLLQKEDIDLLRAALEPAAHRRPPARPARETAVSRFPRFAFPNKDALLAAVDAWTGGLPARLAPTLRDRLFSMYYDTMKSGLPGQDALQDCDTLYTHWVTHFMMAFGETRRQCQLSNAVLRRCLNVLLSPPSQRSEADLVAAKMIWQSHLLKLHKAHWDEERWVLQYQLSIRASQLWPETFPMTAAQHQLDEMARHAFEPNVRVYETILDTISAHHNSALPVDARLYATLRLMKDMQSIAHPITPSICAGLVQACTPQAQQPALHPYMPFILDYIQAKGVVPNTKLLVALVECFAKAQQSTSVRRLLQQYPQAWLNPTVGWTLLHVMPSLKESEYRQLILLARDAPELRPVIQAQLAAKERHQRRSQKHGEVHLLTPPSLVERVP